MVEDSNLIPKSDGQPEETSLVSDEQFMGLFGEALSTIRLNNEEVADLADQFKEMVLNGGDATTSTKETLVSLLKLKDDSVDKMLKVADLWTRMKLKEKNTMPDYVKAKYNTVNIIDQGGMNRRAILDAHQDDIDKAQK